MQIYMCHHDTHPQSNRTVNQSQPLAFVHKFAWGMFEYQNIVIESNAAGIKFDTQRHRHLRISALGCRFHSCHGEGIWWKFVLKHLRPRMAHKINAIHSLGHVSTISFTTVFDLLYEMNSSTKCDLIKCRLWNGTIAVFLPLVKH